MGGLEDPGVAPYLSTPRHRSIGSRSSNLTIRGRPTPRHSPSPIRPIPSQIARLRRSTRINHSPSPVPPISVTTKVTDLRFHEIPLTLVEGAWFRIEKRPERYRGEDVPLPGKSSRNELVIVQDYPDGICVHLTMDDNLRDVRMPPSFPSLNGGPARLRLELDAGIGVGGPQTRKVKIEAKELYERMYGEIPATGGVKTHLGRADWWAFIGAFISLGVLPGNVQAGLERYEPRDLNGVVSIRLFDQEKRFYWHALDRFLVDALKPIRALKAKTPGKGPKTEEPVSGVVVKQESH